MLPNIEYFESILTPVLDLPINTNARNIITFLMQNIKNTPSYLSFLWNGRAVKSYSALQETKFGQISFAGFTRLFEQAPALFETKKEQVECSDALNELHKAYQLYERSRSKHIENQ